MGGGWESEEQLQQQFLTRKGFVFNADKPGMMEQQAELFKSALKTVDVTFQNLDSSEISITDVSHYYDSDPTKVVAGLRDDKKKPMSMMADTTTANAQVRSLSEKVDSTQGPSFSILNFMRVCFQQVTRELEKFKSAYEIQWD